MKRKTGRMLLIIIAILLGLFLIAGVFNATKSRASSGDYMKSDEFSVCFHRCLLDVPTVEACMMSEDDFWEYGRDKKKLLRKECIAIVRDERFNCKLDCYTETLMPKNPERDRAIEFWDKSVRSFPETNE